ncbi:hypothetical protein Q5Y75_17925 [Ruegeria sp. 2205SS24-7]|uniref:hypothetical protein n=1 Tax=Ruegeria discodermiae TaxID=3064389 RepID=UPI0027427E36|nr:hypothetical protein [Ruegeria sp. 2205SS24-7]MDP5219101.1 hypothetical protein [Ruegeria sp. 2205SS24-7]
MTHRHQITRYQGDKPVLRQRFGKKALLALSPGFAVLLSAFLAGMVVAVLFMSLLILIIIVSALVMVALGIGRHTRARRRDLTRRPRPHDMDRG